MVKKILLVEDDDLIGELYKNELTQAGLPTDLCLTGKQAITALAQGGYDLILLDIMLPDTNGLELLKIIKENLATKNIPVMMITNLGQDSVIKQAFDLGAAGYLIKLAYTPDQIVAEVKNVLAQ